MGTHRYRTISADRVNPEKEGLLRSALLWFSVRNPIM